MFSKKEREEIQKGKDGYGFPIPEDNRKILVAKRREGKTQELINIAYGKIESGVSVLFASHHSGIQRFTIDMFLDTNGMSTLEGVYHKMERTITFRNGTAISFKTLEEIKSRGFMSRNYSDHYSIMDNAAMNTYNFDLISVNGELYDE